MTSRDRLIGLGLVWFLYAGLMAVTIFQGSATVAVAVPFMLFLSIITLVASIFLTRAAPPAANQEQGSARAARDRNLTAANPKAKRSDMALVDRLIDSMSDTELDALRRRLEQGQGGSALGADGELLDDDIDLDQLRRRSR